MHWCCHEKHQKDWIESEFASCVGIMKILFLNLLPKRRQKIVIGPYVPLWIPKSGKIKNIDFLKIFWVPNTPEQSGLVLIGNIFLILGSELHTLTKNQSPTTFI